VIELNAETLDWVIRRKDRQEFLPQRYRAGRFDGVAMRRARLFDDRRLAF
jgi:hypothetical protein